MLTGGTTTVQAIKYGAAGSTAGSRGDVIVFGSESRGLPQSLQAAHADRLLTIPSRPQVRSLNLSTCAPIVAYEAIRQWGGDV